MTLTPEPRPKRRPFATSKDAGWTSRAEMEVLELRYIVESTLSQTGLLLNNMDPLIKNIETMTAHLEAITAQVADDISVMVRYLNVAPQPRRRLRKTLRLVAHYQKKLDRIPTWKRTTTPEGTK